MSVQTDADNAHDTAIESVTTAIKSLSKIVIDECWGSGDYNHQHIVETMNQLMVVKNRLKEQEVFYVTNGIGVV